MASKRYVHFYLPCKERNDEFDKVGAWNGTGYDVYTQKPHTVQVMQKTVGSLVIGVEDMEEELRQSIAFAKLKNDENIQRGKMLLDFIAEDNTPEHILSSADKIAIRAYRNSIKVKKECKKVK